MSILQTFPFTDNVNYSVSNAVVEGGKAKLALVPNPGQQFAQNFNDSAGFNYNASKAEFVAGVLRQKDQRNLGAVFAANFNLGINSNWDNIAPVLTGTPSVVGGKLDCLGAENNTGARYTSNAVRDIGQVLTVKFKFTPDYSGTPPANTSLFSIEDPASTTINSILFMHSASAGTFRMQLGDAAGQVVSVGVSNGILNAWSPTAGQEYEFEMNFDFPNNTMRLFIDGVLHSSKLALPAIVRSNTASRVFVGAASIYQYNNGKYDDFIIFNVVQHAANFTPGYTISDYAFAGSKIDGPNFTYSGAGSVLSIDDGSVVESGAPRFIIGLRYWNGSAWVVSNGTYEQANSFSTALANLGSFVASGGVLPWSVVFQDSNSQASVDEFNVEVTGQKYAANGYVEPAQALEVAAITELSLDILETVNSTARIILKIDGVLKYWNGSSWATSDGSFAQANTLEETNTNLSELVFGVNSTVFIRWVLTTSSNTETAEINESTVEYDFGGVETAPIRCLVYGYLKDISGQPIANAKVEFSLVKESSSNYVEANKNVILKAVGQVKSNPQGYFQIWLIRSSEYEAEALYQIKFSKGSSNISGSLTFSVPDAETKDISDLLTAS